MCERQFPVLFSCTVAVLLAMLHPVFAQDTTRVGKPRRLESGSVTWQRQWPESGPAKRHFWEFISGNHHETLHRPMAMLADNGQPEWVLDQEANTILYVENGECSTPKFVTKANPGFHSLVSICRYKDRSMLFTDSYLNQIFLLDPIKKELSVFNNTPLNKPTGIAYSAATHTVYVVETGEHRITVLGENGRLEKTIGTRGKNPGEFNFPTHICTDRDGNLYVVDAMNFRVQIFNATGQLISLFGSNGDATGYFASPKGIAVDSYGNIYVADALFHAVQIFDMQGGFLYSFGTQGQGPEEFWMPNGVFIDSSDRVYVADSYNSRIQIYQLIAEERK